MSESSATPIASPVLTFAEVAFLLRASTDGAELVRAALRLSPETDTDTVVAAGLASLLARGLLLRDDDGDVTPTAEISLVAACFSASTDFLSALGWLGERHVVAHVLSGSRCRLALYPRGLGWYATEVLDPAEPVSAVLGRFLDGCVAGGGETAVLARSGQGPDAVAVSVAVDAAGVWRLSDSVDTPDRSVPTDPVAVRRRFAELFDGDRALVSR